MKVFFCLLTCLSPLILSCAESSSSADITATGPTGTTETQDNLAQPSSTFAAPPRDEMGAAPSYEMAMAAPEIPPSSFIPGASQPSEATNDMPQPSSGSGGQMTGRDTMAEEEVEEITQDDSRVESRDPNILCDDSCEFADDGICSDEILDFSAEGRCVFGTDCTDCGPRVKGSNQSCSLDESDPCPPACNDPCPAGEACRNDLRCHP